MAKSITICDRVFLDECAERDDPCSYPPGPPSSAHASAADVIVCDDPPFPSFVASLLLIGVASWRSGVAACWIAIASSKAQPSQCEPEKIPKSADGAATNDTSVPWGAGKTANSTLGRLAPASIAGVSATAA